MGESVLSRGGQEAGSVQPARILVVDGDVVFYRVLNQRYNDRNTAGHYDIFGRIIRELQSYGRKLLEVAI